jgi:hypothetical protein
MARPKVFTESVLVRLPPGSKDEIRALVSEGEDVADLIRQAIEREIAWRKRRLII